MIVIARNTQDRVEIIASSDEEGTLHGLGAFLSSLLEYFR